MKLSPSRIRRAELQLRQGRGLGQIARSLDVPFGLVCLALFGGGAAWTPPGSTQSHAPDEPAIAGEVAPNADPASHSPETADQSTAARTDVRQVIGSEEDGAAFDAGAMTSQAGTQAPPVDTQSAADADMHRSGRLSGPADPLRSGTAEGDEAGTPAPVPASARFRLHNGLGEYLHEHERGLTRVSKFFWRGTEADVVALWKRRPHFRDLDMEPITDTRVQS